MILAIVAAVFAGAPSSAAEAKKAPGRAPRTWKAVADYVLANGSDRTLKAPLTRDLGFDSDAVATKALRYRPEDSPDRKSHAFYAISAPGKDGKPALKGFILGNGFEADQNGAKIVEDIFLRADLDGKLIAAARSKGPAGHAEEKKLSRSSPAAVKTFDVERKIHLRTMDLTKLTK
jgi:hypothetical protein